MILKGRHKKTYFFLDPPLSTPTPRPIPTLAPAAKTTAMAVSNTGCFVLIGFVIGTLLIFAIFAIIDRGRFIHMNIEIALLCAHICLLIDATGNEVMTSHNYTFYDPHPFPVLSCLQIIANKDTFCCEISLNKF